MSTDTTATKTATTTLKILMQAVGIDSYRALAKQAAVSRWQIQQLRTGNLEKMRVVTLQQISAALNVELVGLIQAFQAERDTSDSDQHSNEMSDRRDAYPTGDISHSHSLTVVQSDALQTDALQTIETWLTQWPTIAKRAQEKGDALPAAKILPFVRPVEQLMQEWNVEQIATVDEQLPYDPQYHQLTKGTANPGELVQATHVGHMHNGKLLHRVKVKPID